MSLMEPTPTEFAFEGFLPNDELCTESQNVLDELIDLAPYGSTAVARFECEGQIFRCSVELLSNAGLFAAKTTQVLPISGLHLVKASLLRKLSKWRETRFQPPSVGQIGAYIQ